MSTASSKERTASGEILLTAGTNEVEIFEFTLGANSYGVNVAKVQQILTRDLVSITRLDMAPPGVLGTMYFRNKPALVLDLKVILGLPEQPIEVKSVEETPEVSSDIEIGGTDQGSSRSLILVTEFNEQICSFCVDSARRIHRISWAQFVPMENCFGERPPYATGIVKLESHMVVILDLEHILATIVPERNVPQLDARVVNSGQGAAARGDLRILFAEDSGMIRKLTVQQLESAGFTHIQTARDGKEAYQILCQLRDQAAAEKKSLEDLIHVVLTDIEMPEMDGLSLCRRIRTELGMVNIPVVVYSSLINEQMIAKCKSVGATAYMSKPQVTKLVEVIDQHGLHRSPSKV
jgi:two-component system chemotaxis response regulator CheV